MYLLTERDVAGGEPPILTHDLISKVRIDLPLWLALSFGALEQIFCWINLWETEDLTSEAAPREFHNKKWEQLHDIVCRRETASHSTLQYQGLNSLLSKKGSSLEFEKVAAVGCASLWEDYQR